ncbi:MAG: hypothetical protein WA183_03395 [Chthoniobacterales bacterium]
MKIQIVTSLLSLSLLSACSTTTQTTTVNQTSEQRMAAKYASIENAEEPAPPAEGPDDIPAVPVDVKRNPGLVPTPLLRDSAASSTP